LRNYLLTRPNKGSVFPVRVPTSTVPLLRIACMLLLAVLPANLSAVVVEESAMALIDAIRSNDLPRAEEVLDASGNAAAHMTLYAGVTPLHIAAALNRVELTSFLIERGAEIDARTKGGFTPLHWAAARNAADTTELLLEHGADMNATTRNGITPLHWAANNNSTNVVQLFLARGAKPLPVTNSGMTPLHWAVMNESQGAAVSLAFQAVTDQMAAETNLTESTAESPENEEAPDRESALPSVDEAAPMDHLPRPAFGRKLIVPLGFGENLTFIWIGELRMWIGEHEITNGQFRRFRPNHKSMFNEGFSLNGNSQPVVYVSWHDAMDLCKWLNKTHLDRIPRGCHFRLPEDREWLFVAQCGDHRIYPWGNEWPPKYGNFSDLTARKAFTRWEGIRHYDDGSAVTCPVFQSGANEWGIYGLAGNVWEWCADWYDSGKTYKVRHGGCWDFDGEPSLRNDTRGFDRPDARYDTIGIRLVVGRTGRPMVKQVE